MSLLLAEGIADKTLAYLSASQTAKLAAVDARSWDKTLAALPTFRTLRYSDPNREHEPQFPALYMIPIDATLDPTKGAGSVVSTMTWAFWVVAMGNGVPAEALTPAEHSRRLVGRYVMAVYEMLVGMSADLTGTYYVGGQRLHWGTGGSSARIEYGINATGPNGEYLADARLIIGLSLKESIT